MKTIRVEVVLALPDRQQVVTVELAQGATAQDAVAASGLPLPGHALGRFGRRIDLATVLRGGDRVEILRTLGAEPWEARRRRARLR